MNRRIFAALVTVAGFSVVVKAIATIKELAVAYRFGTGDAVDVIVRCDSRQRHTATTELGGGDSLACYRFGDHRSAQ